jgi:hypothetical protein
MHSLFSIIYSRNFMKFQASTTPATKLNSQRRVTLMGLSALALAGSISSFAQNAERKDVINVPCCQCIDGKETVIDLSTGGTAPWTSPSGAVSAATPAGPWASSPPAKWIYTGNTARGLYTYQLAIHIPKCIIPMSIKIEGKGWGDDIFKMQLDGNPMGSSSNAAVVVNQIGGTWPSTAYNAGSYGGFGASNVLNISQNLSGSGANHVLTAIVDNAGGPTGFLFNGKLTMKCSSGPLTQGGRD